ncbi:Calcium-dependent lipid-binding (CaLB domain) family protein [Raphanus sativus]|uniref:Uncharacterized protein LOC108833484 n=1 Tax=Raphanus sativus TaxID=3726 RepID=A0A6J0LSS0_RAPSA|nr:uncharacterized protein LOC108833484 [Raphanus sativus]KAJ4876787.1 Calcium-dependent lipid-binding (CaLB domain) family protein [Raphanus sativus]
MSFLAPCQILEMNIISAQELAPVARCMKTYAIAWIDPERKLTTRVDNTGGTSPTWNDKFVFRLDEEALYDGTSIVVIEIYALHWFKDIHVGTVQTLISDLVDPSSGMRFVTLEVLRASGRPHGLLNIAVGLIDNSGQSMPLLYEEDLMFHKKNIPSKKTVGLRRSKSDTSSMVEVTQQTHVSSTTNSGFEKDEFSSDSQMVVYEPPQRKTPNTMWRQTKNIVHGTPMRPRNTNAYTPKRNRIEYGTPMRSRQVVITESDLGPSASVVAAQIAKEKALTGRDAESTVISVGERSVEGLRSKLERWQANLPVVLDVGSSYQPSSDYKTSSNFKPKSSYKKNETVPRNQQMVVAPLPKQGGRNKKGGDNGLFSCFGNICGIECSIVCGGSGGQKASKKKKKK